MSILDRIPKFFGLSSTGEARPKRVGFKKLDKKIFFSGRRDFVKRNDLVKKITLDKDRIPQTGWKAGIRGSYSSRAKRKALAESLFPKEKFGEYVSRKALQETMRDLEQKGKAYKPSQEKFDALQKYNYLKKKTGL
ncbi:MAG: hypothetical protein V1819_01710 [bacterium]